ncbi:MAG: LysM peptidoglycan-binding domain-containing protein [Chloroflexi bacterium]|nr:LysM peptidoglycan-binding domain-containing protein [Chloroflexota bacterium]
MLTATPYPTYTPVPPAPIYTPPPAHADTIVPGTPESQAGATFRTHIVVAGDTLSGLARKYGTTVEAIMEANGLSDPGLIIVGQVLSIPVEEAPATPTSPPTLVPPTATPTEIPAP